MITVAETIAARMHNLDPAKRRGPRPVSNPGPGLLDAPEPASAGGPPTYRDAKTRREHAQASLAELELAERSGKLLDRQEASDAFFTIGQMLREQLEVRAQLLAGRLAGTTDAAAIAAAITEEDRALLQRLADEIKQRFTPTVES